MACVADNPVDFVATYLFSPHTAHTDRHDWDGDSEMSPAWFGPGKIERKPRSIPPV